MADTAFENAMNRREAALAKVKALEAELLNARSELERVDAFIQQWHEFAGTPVLDRDPVVVHYSKPASGGVRAVRNSKKEEVAAAARRIIEAEGHPLSRTELYDRLIGSGLTINGADPEMVLSTMLWRMKDQIVRLAKGGYWLADKPYKTEFYSADPARDDLLNSVDDAPPGIVDMGEDDQ
jgi:hypothetical protein